MAPSHVLVPLDGSPLADDALTFVLETFDCRVTVLNVVTPIDSSMSEGGVLDSEHRKEEALDRAEDVVEAARRRAEERGVTVETAIETGDPGDSILRFVEENDVEHVVMGGHGGPQQGTIRRLLGTVTTEVVGNAAVTVTVVR